MTVQDAVDASDHYEIHTTEDVPSLLTVIIDTNPRAWAAIADVLPFSKAIANILVFVNNHLAFSNANQVAIIASHTNRAVWLYPTPSKPQGKSGSKPHSSNKYPQFAQIEQSFLAAVRALVDETTADDISSTTTTQISGALTLALCHINKTALSLSASANTTGPAGSASGGPGAGGTKNSHAVSSTAISGGSSVGLTGLHARILVVSVSDSSPSQYIPTMNAVFAASHARIAVDTLALRGNATFLQQASFLTGGTFIRASEPRGLLQYLMLGFGRGAAGGGAEPVIGSNSAVIGAASTGGVGMPGVSREKPVAAGVRRKGGKAGGAGASAADMLITPSADSVDFRAVCFCHRKVIDLGYMCSICLSIYCEPPAEGECLTCGTKLPPPKQASRRAGAGNSGSPSAARKKSKVNGEA